MSDPQLFGRLDGKPRIGAPGQRWQARLTDEQGHSEQRMETEMFAGLPYNDQMFAGEPREEET